jgi:hypothetical protein
VQEPVDPAEPVLPVAAESLSPPAREFHAAVENPSFQLVAGAQAGKEALRAQGLEIKGIRRTEHGREILRIGMTEESVDHPEVELGVLQDEDRRQALLTRLNGGTAPELDEDDQRAIAAWRERQRAREGQPATGAAESPAVEPGRLE